MRVAGALSGPRMNKEVFDIWMSNWANADASLAKLIQSYINDIQTIKNSENNGLLLSEEHSDFKEFLKDFYKTSNVKTF